MRHSTHPAELNRGEDLEKIVSKIKGFTARQAEFPAQDIRDSSRHNDQQNLKRRKEESYFDENLLWIWTFKRKEIFR